MRFFSFRIVKLLLIVILAIIVVSSADVPKRSKISQLYGITPTLRVGRSKWGSPYNEENKRYGKLTIFPRVGRSELKNWQNDDIYGKRGGSNTGMWFGPRLGRVQKRNIALANNEPWTYIIFKGLPITRLIKYKPEMDLSSASINLDADGYKETAGSISSEEQSSQYTIPTNE